MIGQNYSHVMSTVVNNCIHKRSHDIVHFIIQRISGWLRESEQRVNVYTSSF